MSSPAHPRSVATLCHNPSSYVWPDSVRASALSTPPRSASRDFRLSNKACSVSEKRRLGRPSLTVFPPLASSGQVLPWDILVDPGLGRQAEHALGDDVAEDLRGAALDRVTAGAQVAVAGATPEEVGVLRAAHAPVVVTQAIGPGQL